MNRFEYPVLLTPAEEGGYVVTCRDLPQLVTQGETVEDALEEAADAMDEVFATYLLAGIDFPPPRKLRRR
jgi:antitoxin HicB